VSALLRSCLHKALPSWRSTHYSERESCLLERFRGDAHVSIIDMTRSVEDVVKAITECEVIAASALHGLVVADAYGIPSIWLELSGKLLGGDFKFLDYFQSVGRHDVAPTQLTHDSTVESLLQSRREYRINVDLVKLLKACPFLGGTRPSAGHMTGMTNAKPAIAVVIPLYNKLNYIKRALDSVLAQTVRDFEIIVINDGSTDGSQRVVERCADPRVRLLHQKNGGVSAARNRGIAAARAELVAFLDADDEWLPEHLAAVQRMHRRFPNCGAYATARRIMEPDGRSWTRVFTTIPAPLGRASSPATSAPPCSTESPCTHHRWQSRGTCLSVWAPSP